MPIGIGEVDRTRKRDKRSFPGTRHLPIVPQLKVKLALSERQRLRKLARHLIDDDPSLACIPFEGDLKGGLGPYPSVIFEDHGSIVGIKPEEQATYVYRGLLLAGEGDLFILDQQRCPAFELYCRATLGLGRVDILAAAPSAEHSMTRRILRDGHLLDRLARRARRAGGMNVVPYMGTGGAWAVAGALAKRSGAPIRVAAPPPGLTDLANDKLWFAARVIDILGRRAAPLAYAAYGPAAMVGLLRWLAKRYPSVALKLPSSASSEGNFLFVAEPLLAMSAGKLMREVIGRLERSGWRRQFPVQVTAWERPVLASPSAQLWIPQGTRADPVVEGVFDQVLTGAVARFSGAEPSALPSPWIERIGAEAVRLGFFLQQLGYVGRCSFDAIILGDDLEHAELHWIECNGRWGGVSIPMTLLNRLVGDWMTRPFLVVDWADNTQEPEPFTDFLQRMKTSMFGVDGRQTGAIVLSPTRIETGRGHLLAIVGETIAEARDFATMFMSDRGNCDKAAGQLG